MRIALDAAPLSEPYGGIRRYVVELVRALAAGFPQDTYYLMADRAGLERPGDLLARANVEWVEPEPHWLGKKWWSLGLPWTLRRLRVDVFHGTDFALPYWGGARTVLTVHDLSPWKPAPLGDGVSARVQKRGPGSIRRAGHLLTPTEAIAREVMAEFAVPRSKLTATPLGVTSWERAEPEKCAIPKPYFLYVGSAAPRKNLGALLAAWEQVSKSLAGWSLVLAGGAGTGVSMPGVLDLGTPADGELAAALSGADAFVYPSLYEGFGLPVIEAMALGVPVIASQDAALREVSGGVALHVEASDTAALGRALVEVAGEPSRRVDMGQRGRERAGVFTWSKTAELTHAVYEKAVDRA